eukprot:gnl/MRDRNA2_/MRDRNA2_220278_c0_seq1.p1 gnl/MRDRNA2_/MRDRNA2_220278_c0~~gnl/MRDRNA2_/MRDRNA2_220278_c0_seq1.p1  ORF type:complete len:150 (+),score=25.48 gnl/MRDRNA2_/MRDRNA2_220278_c0_seq1:35-451(+)
MPVAIEEAHRRLANLKSELQVASDQLCKQIILDEQNLFHQKQDSQGADRWAYPGVALRQPISLESVYGLHTQPTHVVPRYVNTLDWICIDMAHLRVESTAPLPSIEELTREVAMPCKEWPSDHVSLICDLVWREDSKE